MAVASKKKKIFDGRYEVLAIVGRGAASVVYHARHAMTSSSEVALKVLLNQKGGTPSTDRLRKEALAMVSSRHKYVVRLDDFHSVQDLCYLSMEYAREGDLRKFAVKRGGTLSLEQASLFFQQTAEGLNFVHRVGITHRDIKPDNILVMNEKEIRLADFGVAVLPGELASMEELRQGIGTMSYMAPEVLEGKVCDKISDIYSLGVSFYEMISGVHPFENAPLIKQLEIREDRNIAHIKDLTPKIPAKLAEVIMRCMRYDPSHRFQSMAELLKTLGGGASEPTKPRPDKQMAQPSRVVKPGSGKVAPSPSALRSTQGEKRPKPAAAKPPKPPPIHKDTKPAPSKSFEPLPFDDSPFDFDDEIDDLDFDEVVPIVDKPAVKQSRIPDPQPVAENESEQISEDTAEIQPNDAPVAEPEAAMPEEETQTEPEPQEDNYSVNLDEPENFEEAEERPRTRPERRDKPVRDKPNALVAGRRKSPTSLIPTIITVILVIYAGKFIINKLSSLTIFSGSGHTADVAAGRGDFIPRVNQPIEAFPFLPAGMYSGSISGVIPGAAYPLTIISFPQSKSLAFIVGMDGWTPNLVSLEKFEKQPQKEGPKKIRVASNGLVLDLIGEAKDGGLQGTFINAVSGEKGSWSAEPVGTAGGGN